MEFLIEIHEGAARVNLVVVAVLVVCIGSVTVVAVVSVLSTYVQNMPPVELNRLQLTPRLHC